MVLVLNIHKIRIISLSGVDQALEEMVSKHKYPTVNTIGDIL